MELGDLVRVKRLPHIIRVVVGTHCYDNGAMLFILEDNSEWLPGELEVMS